MTFYNLKEGNFVKAIKRISVLVLALVMVFTLCMSSQTAYAANKVTITFKDSIVYEQVVSNLSNMDITTDDDKMQITMNEEDIKSVKSLRIKAPYGKYEFIKDISGLENFTGLTELIIWDSYYNDGQVPEGTFSDLSPLKGLTGLTKLEIRGTHASSVDDIAGLTNLTSLKIESPKHLDLSAIGNLTNLKTLSLEACGIDNEGFNYITDKLTGLTSLELGYLNYEGNDISDISSITKLTKLQTLYLDNNNIADITPLSELTDLEFLSIRCNLVTDISALGNLTNLETLYLGRDTLGGVPINGNISALGNLTKLRNLYAAGCGITDIKALEPIVSNLQALDLTENSITDFSLLQEKYTNNQTWLKINNQVYNLKANSEDTVELPQIVLDAIYDNTSFVYTEQLEKNLNFSTVVRLDGCKFSEDGKSVIIDKNVATAKADIGYHCHGYKYSAKIVYDVTDVSAPEVETYYSTKKLTNKDVTVTLVADEDIQAVAGYDKVTDREYRKVYTANANEGVDVYDIAGNKTVVTVDISNIDRTAPEVTATYSTKELTNGNVEVTLTTDEDVRSIEGFTKVDDRTYKKTYTSNAKEDVTVYDMAGNKTVVTVEVTNIDKIAPEVTVAYSTKGLTNGNVEVTLTADENVQSVEGFTKVDDRTYKKTYTSNAKEDVTVYDMAGNKTVVTVEVTNIDKTAPEVEATYSTKELTNGSVEVTLTANEDVRSVSGFTKVDNRTYKKTYTSNAKEDVTVYDIAGNKTVVTVEVTNIDKTAPEVKATYSTKELTNRNVEVTLTANGDVQSVEGFTKVDNRTYKKTYTSNAKEDVTVYDIAGNKTVVTVEVTNIDKTAPEVKVTYSTKEITYDAVEVTLTANENVQAIEGFTKVDDRTYKKTFAKNTDINVDVFDIAGNKTVVNISITNITEKPTVPEEPETPVTPPTEPVTPESPSAVEEPAVAPKTGDNSMAAMYAIIAGISGAVVLLSAKKKKYNR